MAITLRSSREIGMLRRAGAVVAEVLSKIEEAAEPGISTGRLNVMAIEITKAASAKALFEGVESPYASLPFPGAICASINEQIVHGIPSMNRRVKDGDLLSVDYGAKLAGYCADAAVTIGIGRVSAQRQKLIDVTRELLDIAIARSTPGLKWSGIAGLMEACAKRAGLSVVTDFVGHGIGREMHEEPRVPNFVSDDLLSYDIVLREGMILAVEPMINAGTSEVRTLKNGWTVVTKDGKYSAHIEHTIAIVENGCEVLTAKR